MLVREGPEGIGFEALPENKRSKRKVEYTGCFAIGLYAPETGDPYLALLNRYFRVGHLFHELEITPPPQIPAGATSVSPLLALSVTANTAVPTASLVSFADYEALKTAAEDLSKAIVPLYLFKFDAAGQYAGVAVDFRNLPAINMTEG